MKGWKGLEKYVRSNESITLKLLTNFCSLTSLGKELSVVSMFEEDSFAVEYPCSSAIKLALSVDVVWCVKSVFSSGSLSLIIEIVDSDANEDRLGAGRKSQLYFETRRTCPITSKNLWWKSSKSTDVFSYQTISNSSLSKTSPSLFAKLNPLYLEWHMAIDLPWFLVT